MPYETTRVEVPKIAGSIQPFSVHDDGSFKTRKLRDTLISAAYCDIYIRTECGQGAGRRYMLRFLHGIYMQLCAKPKLN